MNWELVAVIGFYILSVWLILSRMYHAYLVRRFSFHLLFSAIYVVVFYAGFPFSLVLAWQFQLPLAESQGLFLSFALFLAGYFIYDTAYHWQLWQSKPISYPITLQHIAKKEAKWSACLLILLALACLGVFIYLNQGLLLFKLEKYQHIFSTMVKGVALKRFFYFMLAGLLILFLFAPSRKTWWWFGAVALSFGLLSYVAVGGTRANLALALMFFVLLGIYFQYLRLRWLALLAGLAVIVMFWLALTRYSLAVEGREMLFTFLYLTRDTFSPWENAHKILISDFPFQGLMPIVRDFYVFIPDTLWTDRPDIAWNTANYFTKVILGNESGMAISPTILGSFYIMGGYPMVLLGMVFSGLLIKGIDVVFEYGRHHLQQGRAAIIQAYCWANLFNLIVLVREGMDGFVSRFFFFSAVFGLCWLLARIIALWGQDEQG